MEFDYFKSFDPDFFFDFEISNMEIPTVKHFNKELGVSRLPISISHSNSVIMLNAKYFDSAKDPAPRKEKHYKT